MKNEMTMEVTTENNRLEFALPPESRVSSVHVGGKQFNQTCDFIRRLDNQKKVLWGFMVWVFLFTLTAISMGAWLVHRVRHLPADTAAVERIIDRHTPPAFEVGYYVNINGEQPGMVRRVSRKADGSYQYMVRNTWYPQDTMGYISNSRPDHWGLTPQ